MPSERDQISRRTRRYATAENAFAVFNPDSIVECLVTDLSSKGARLQFKLPVRLPRDVSVLFRRTGESSVARVVWQVDRQAGVQFEHPPISAEQLTDPDAARMAELSDFPQRSPASLDEHVELDPALALDRAVQDLRGFPMDRVSASPTAGEIGLGSGELSLSCSNPTQVRRRP